MKYKLKLLVVLVLVASVIGTINAQDDEDYVIGLIGYFDYSAVADELAELGYIEGENITYLFPFVENWDQLSPEEGMVAYQEAYEEIASSPDVDLFLTNTDTDAAGLLPFLDDPATPIVFARSDDPVATGVVEDLVVPGGNITGTITNRPHERRLQILTEINPDTDTILYLYNTMTGEAETVREQVEMVAEELGVEVIVAPVVDTPTGMAVLEDVAEEVDWLFLTPFVPLFDPVFIQAMNTLSIERQIGIAAVIDQPQQGIAMGYGPNLQESDRQAAHTIDRILRGADPADLPVQIADNYLMINLETAEAIGLEVPVEILRQANTIVRPGDFDETTGLYIGNG